MHDCVTSVWLFFCKQKTSYNVRISDWSSDVSSSDLDLDHLVMLAIKAIGEAQPGGIAAPVLFLQVPLAFLAPADTRRARRSEERRVATGCVSTCRPRWSPSHQQTKENNISINLRQPIDNMW